ncbi:MAG: cysteine desulfurase family protein [Steroidobacteraceae bacterium]
MIYFDNNSTTAVAPECRQAMLECMQSGPLNPSSKHAQGERAKHYLMTARAQVAQLLGALPPEVVFTSSGTEANHMAILGALALQPQRRHIISSEVEHPATLMLLRHLQTQGVRVTYLPVDHAGRLNLEALADTLTADTALVSLMWVNNETGVLFPIASAAQMVRQHGALFHTDAVQAVGKLPINLQQLPVDLLSLSAHKLHAPGGVGALYVRKGIKLPPLLFGSQERGRRAGTENLPGIVALGVACAMLQQNMATQIAHTEQLRQRLEVGVLAAIPCASINGAAAARLSNTSNIRFGDLDAELILGRLDRLGIYASAGAACSSAGTKPSHVLTAMGLSPAAALASVRFSLDAHNTVDEVDVLLGVLPDMLRELAQLSA